MRDWQERVIDEKNDLDEKIPKLELFINKSDTFQKLGDDYQELMREQLTVMRTYSGILKKRIENFQEDTQ
jgi:hypothetical protein